MLFSWDPAKAWVNVKKHGVSFELAQTVFDDPLHASVLDKRHHREERWVTLGLSAAAHILVVVHTYSVVKGTEMIRIISARKATRREKRQYEEGI
ncbi:MAG: BrnT family toxin [Deltaproteobacteria bacterium]|nr:BrnT family toxin [Deltaproteobacteria bacterium]